MRRSPVIQGQSRIVKRYLFFLNHYNDIDNIAPAIYFYLEQDDNNRADVVLYSREYDFRSDPNLLLLKSRFGARFSYRWLGSYFGLDFADHLTKLRQAKNRWSKVKRYISHNIIKSPIKEVNVDNIRTGVIDQDCITKGVRMILNEHPETNLVVFEMNRSSHFRGLVRGVRECGVERIVCLANSPQMNYNILRETSLVDVFSDDIRSKLDHDGIDAFGVTDQYLVDSYNALYGLLGFRSGLLGNTECLGSIRYCPEWMQIRETLIKPFCRDTRKIKVVLFLSAPQGNANWEEVERTLRILSLFQDYDVVVKNHTRHPSKTRGGGYPNITFADTVESSALINWAEVVLFWSTSAALEGYVKGKTMVCLKHIVANKNLYAEYNAGYVTHCRDDLVRFLSLYPAGRGAAEYNYDGVVKLIRGVVTINDGSVPKKYLQFMKQNEFTYLTDAL